MKDEFKKEIKISGMHCMGCVSRVTNKLKDIKGVTDVVVSLENKNAFLSSKKEIDDRVIIDAINTLGFEVEEIIKK